MLIRLWAGWKLIEHFIVIVKQKSFLDPVFSLRHFLMDFIYRATKKGYNISMIPYNM